MPFNITITAEAASHLLALPVRDQRIHFSSRAADKFDRKKMAFHSGHTRIRILRGDITKLAVDAIVNAANESLLGGGGVDGAIHDAAGPRLLEECRKLGGCPTSEARITGGCDLPAKYVIHTVGPIWRGGRNNEDELLARCYRNSLALAAQHGIHTIAFPAISTGAFGFPLRRATVIAVHEVRNYLGDNLLIDTVTFVCFDAETLATYRDVIGR